MEETKSRAIETDGDERKELEEDADENGFCTFAVTGATPAFQSIFLCNECVLEEGDEVSNAPLCICQACANLCHDDGYHDVDYVGMGPSYCDCHRLGNCKLHERSLEKAKTLGIMPQSQPQETNESSSSSSHTGQTPTTFVQEAFDVPILKEDGNGSFVELLVKQAQELILHTKETHWIDKEFMERMGETPNSLSLLESLAWSVYQSHLNRYGDRIQNDGKGGAEWWVQVKDVSKVPEKTTNEGKPLVSSSIDLHYDKDEALAETFGIGSFPELSTVTYLTAPAKNAAPTVVFDHTYTQGEDEVMSSMMVSLPRVGKHICFDGRLLHGAPYHPSLVPSGDDSHEHPSVRVTFLVNLWNHRRPASIHYLEPTVRQAIMGSSNDEPAPNQLDLIPLVIPKVAFETEESLPEACQDRVELPFVSNLTGDDDDDEVGGMVVVTFPPPPIDDCALVTFGRGLQAYLDYNYGTEEEGDFDDDSLAAEYGDDSRSELDGSLVSKSQTDYV